MTISSNGSVFKMSTETSNPKAEITMEFASYEALSFNNSVISVDSGVTKEALGGDESICKPGGFDVNASTHVEFDVSTTKFEEFATELFVG